jgi:hypothetical protein
MTITPSRINIIAAFAFCVMVVPEFAAAASSPQDQKPKVEAENITEVARNFVHPPASARPWVYCCWCNGNVTKEGITADLEAMARVGIGGLLIFDAAVQEPAGRIIYNSPQWHEMIRFTLGEVTGLWQVTFPFQNGNVSLDKLASWSDSNRNDVKYFSGTATYQKTFRLPAEMAGPGRRLYLDLGNVKVNAQVTLNGRKLDLLWKAPYQLEITSAVKPGDNLLEIAVTNLWPNRLIGDAHLPPEKERNVAEGSMRSWPQWLLDGKPDPSGRQSFTSNEIWKKNDALLPSGLLGSVVLRASAEVAVP